MEHQDNSSDAFARAIEERRADPSKRRSMLPDDFASRPLGLVLLAVGMLTFWSGSYFPIVAAHAGSPSVKFDAESLLIQPFAFVVGGLYTAFGANCSKVLGPTRKPSIWGWTLLVACGALGFVYLTYFNAYLRALGYQV